MVERPVRECVKLFNIEDTSLLDDIANVQKACQKILNKNKIMTENEPENKPEVMKPKETRNPKPEDNPSASLIKEESRTDFSQVNIAYEDISLLQLETSKSSRIFKDDEDASSSITDWSEIFEVQEEDFIDSIMPVTLI